MAEQPPSQQENPFFPPGTEPLVFDNFLGGIDTASSRPGIGDEYMSWCDGFMPLGKNNLRTLPGVGAQLYQAPNGTTISYYAFANIASTAVAIVFLSNGRIVQVATAGGQVTNIAPAGTINNPAQRNIGVSQWGSQYILIVTEQVNGYFIWDGTALYTSGTIAPIVNVTNSGMGYTSPPTITVSGGSGHGATFTVDINAGVVQNVFVKNPGTGYVVGDTPILTFSGGGTDSTASATAHVVKGGGIESVNVTRFGNNYGAGSFVVVDSPPSGGVQALLSGQFSNGQVVGVQVINPGRGYLTPPPISISDPTGHGMDFQGTAILSTGQIGSITITSGGSGYFTPPTVAIIGDGQGATASAIVSNGMVTALTITNPGTGYSKAQVTFTGGNNAASATIDIMPFGVKGSAVETYQSRAWIVDGSLLQFTAPESLGDFATSDGGGFAQSTDSFLRVRYIRPIQTNGFLYLMADSSLNYISGVQTSGEPATTTYTNQNADPEIGTPFPDAVSVFSRNIVFANSFGVHVSYGGAVTKISEALDGVYNTVPNFGGFQPSCAKAIIFGKKVWMVLLPIVDPITGSQENKLFMWNGKVWWTSSQNINLTFIQSQEINSVLTAWGTDGQGIYPLFKIPTRDFTKTVQSKLWDKPGSYLATKTASRFGMLAYYYNPNGGRLNVTIDNEDASSDVYAIDGVPGLLIWHNNAGDIINWETQFIGGTPIIWTTGAGTGVFVSNPIAVAQNGVLTGLTITTSAADMALISATVIDGFWESRL